MWGAAGVVIYSWDSGVPDPDALLISWITLGHLLNRPEPEFSHFKSKTCFKDQLRELEVARPLASVTPRRGSLGLGVSKEDPVPSPS